MLEWGWQVWCLPLKQLLAKNCRRYVVCAPVPRGAVGLHILKEAVGLGAGTLIA